MSNTRHAGEGHGRQVLAKQSDRDGRGRHRLEQRDDRCRRCRHRGEGPAKNHWYASTVGTSPRYTSHAHGPKGIAAVRQRAFDHRDRARQTIPTTYAGSISPWP